MKTRDFVWKECEALKEGEHWHAVRNGTGTKYVANTLCDGRAVYSFGKHYPLFFMIEHPETKKRFSVRNIAGYSRTTSKHIAQCPRADIDVRLNGVNMTAENVLSSLKYQLHFVEGEMNGTLERYRKSKKYMRKIEERDYVESRIKMLTAS